MKEIEIPEGYEARIEGNKVILERKESEDERIRRIMIEHFKNQPEQYTFGGLTNAEVVDYLKRHKEPSSYSDLEITDVVRKALQECEGYKNCRCDVYAARVGAVVEGLLQEQQPAGWSEEDETCLEDALWCVTKTRHFVAKDACDLDACRCAERWLESLPERFNLQPKQVWSEEDKNRHYYLCKLLRETWDKVDKGSCIDDAIAWLEELPERILPHSWKPSEEQMEALEHFIRSYGESGTMSPENSILCAAKSLLNDLKEL